jgi:hypothetical protein
MQAHHSVEHAASCEVEDSECKLLDGVVFDIDSVVCGLLESADTHIRNRCSSLWYFRMGEMVSQET